MYEYAWSEQRELKQLVVSYTDKHGNRKYDGDKKAMKASQHYPFNFGLALHLVTWRHRQDIQNRSEKLTSEAYARCLAGDLPSADADLWQDALVPDVLRYLARHASTQV